MSPRFYAVTRTQLGSIPCARFRDSNSFYGNAPRWFIRLHVKKLSDNVWKAKMTNIRSGYHTAKTLSVTMQPNSVWKKLRAERVEHLNRNRESLDAFSPENCCVSADVAIDVSPPKRRKYNPVPRALSALCGGEMGDRYTPALFIVYMVVR